MFQTRLHLQIKDGDAHVALCKLLFYKKYLYTTNDEYIFWVSSIIVYTILDIYGIAYCCCNTYCTIRHFNAHHVATDVRF